MSTFLFDKIIFGPVKSRRLGTSLGINLLPTTSKYCNFNCIYCECGWSEKHKEGGIHLHPTNEVLNSLRDKLKDMSEKKSLLDVITFAGNGEPTMHPEFDKIIDGTIQLRNKYFPNTKIAVLSNATLLDKPLVFNALLRIDQHILKLDSGIEETCKLINKPAGNFSLQKLIVNLKRFDGNLIIQSLFFKGIFEGITIDNTTDIEIEKWLEIIKEIKPSMVMIYTINRDTPAEGLIKIDINELNKIAKKVNELGIKTSVSE